MKATEKAVTTLLSLTLAVCGWWVWSPSSPREAGDVGVACADETLQHTHGTQTKKVKCKTIQNNCQVGLVTCNKYRDVNQLDICGSKPIKNDRGQIIGADLACHANANAPLQGGPTQDCTGEATDTVCKIVTNDCTTTTDYCSRAWVDNTIQCTCVNGTAQRSIGTRNVC